MKIQKTLRTKWLFSLLMLASPLAWSENGTKKMCEFISDQSIDIATKRDAGISKQELDSQVPSTDPIFYVLMRKLIEDVYIDHQDRTPKETSLDVYHTCMQRSKK